jgi:DedD protein
MMEQQLKQRLVGAAVLLGMAVLFIPMVLNNSGHPDSELDKVDIPARPEGFSSRIVPLDPAESTDKSESSSQTDEVNLQEKFAETENLPLEPMPAGPEKAESEKEPAGGDSPVRAGITAWAVQLGSFASEENARALEQRLLKLGYAAFVETINDSKKKVFRVRIGPELLKSAASKLVEQLEAETKLKGIVVRYP